MARLYTRGGDTGQTSLLDGTRVPKTDPRIKLNGSIDEAQSVMGLARSLAPEILTPEILTERIERLQEELVSLMAHVVRGKREASPPDAARLESEIDELETRYPHQPRFITPGTSSCGAALHMARSIVRRGERLALGLLLEGQIDEAAYQYMNRLSDLLYAMALAADTESLVDRITKSIVGGDTNSKVRLNLETARTLILRAREEAENMGVPMVLTVCNAEGDLIALERMDGSLRVSLDLAPRKARTAARVRIATDELATLVQPGASLYGLASDPELCCFGGGIPLICGETVLGAVGISGGTVEEDIRVARVATAAWQTHLKTMTNDGGEDLG